MTETPNPEQKGRDTIDAQLTQAGWIVQKAKNIDPNAGLGQAVCEYNTDVGPADQYPPHTEEEAAALRGFAGFQCYNPRNRHRRKETWNRQSNPGGCWRKFSYEQIIARDKTSLDIFWLKDKRLADLDNLQEPDELAGEIIESLEAGLNSFRAIAAALS